MRECASRGCASRGSFENKNNYKETGGASWVRSKKHPGKGVCIFKFENMDNYSEPGWDIWKQAGLRETADHAGDVRLGNPLETRMITGNPGGAS